MIPLAGDEVDELPDVERARSAARTRAIAESLGHLQGGGSPTDGFVTGPHGQDQARDRRGRRRSPRRKSKSGATLRVTGSGDGGGFTAGVSLVIVF